MCFRDFTLILQGDMELYMTFYKLYLRKLNQLTLSYVTLALECVQEVSVRVIRPIF